MNVCTKCHGNPLNSCHLQPKMSVSCWRRVKVRGSHGQKVPPTNGHCHPKSHAANMLKTTPNVLPVELACRLLWMGAPANIDNLILTMYESWD